MKGKSFVLMISAVMLMSSFGCAGSSENKDSSRPESTASSLSSVQNDETSVQSEEETGSEPLILESNAQDHSRLEFSLDNRKPFDTIEEYLATDTAKKMIEQLSGPDEQGVIITRIYAERATCLVFERKISEDFNMWLTEDFVKNITESVGSKSNTFSALVDSLESCINRKNITVAVRYLDPDGNLLYEKIFDNDHLEKENSESSAQESGKAKPEASSQESSKAKPEASSQESGKAKPEASSQESSKAKPETSSQESGKTESKVSSKSSKAESKASA